MGLPGEGGVGVWYLDRDIKETCSSSVDVVSLNVVAFAGLQGNTSLGGGSIANVEYLVLATVGVDERTGCWIGGTVRGRDV